MIPREIPVQDCPQPRTLVIGLGSPHGDDQAGWLLAEELQRRIDLAAEVRLLALPIDMLGLFESFDRVIVLDSVSRALGGDRLQRWEWPSSELARSRVGGTHAVGVVETIELAETLGNMPETVILWGIAGDRFSPGDDVSIALRETLPSLADRIVEREQLRTPTRSGSHA